MTEAEETEEKPLRNFLVRVEVEDLDGNNPNEIMDIVPAEDHQDARDYVVGWLAIRGYKVTRWHTLADADQIRRAVTIISR